MAEYYTCDGCNCKFRGEAPVILKGVAGRLGLALPGEYQERAFCGEACFWRWKGDNAPIVQPVSIRNDTFEP